MTVVAKLRDVRAGARPAARFASGRANYAPTAPSPGRRARELGEILVALGRIGAPDLERILAAQEKSGGAFGAAAARLGLLQAGDVEAAIAVRHGFVAAEPRALTLPKDLVVIRKPYSPQAEQIRLLRTRLLTAIPADRLSLFSVIAAGRCARADYVAANLAASFAQLKRRVLLVDADLRAPRLARFFALPVAPGLGGALAGQVGLCDAIEESAVVGLSLLAAGERAANPQELLAGEAMRKALQRARAEHDIVIVLTTGMGPAADGQLVLALTKSALVVARRGEARARELKELHATLRRLDAEILGAAMTS